MKFLSGNLFRRNVVEEMQTDSADDCQVNSKLNSIKNQIISKKSPQQFVFILQYGSNKSILNFFYELQKIKKIFDFSKKKSKLIGTSTFLVILSSK